MRTSNWVVAVVIALLLVALIAFARGGGRPAQTGSPARGSQVLTAPRVA